MHSFARHVFSLTAVALGPRSGPPRIASALAAIVLAAGAAPARSEPAAASGPAFAPHRAVYALSRDLAGPDGAVSAVTGRLEVAIEASCDGWRIEQFLGFRMFGVEGDWLEHLAHLSAFESADGDRYWFETRSFEDRTLVEELSGVADVPPGGGAGAIRFAKPEPERRSLPPGTLFPIAHFQALLRAARDGERSLRRVVFDGSSVDSPFEISAFFARGRPGDTATLPALRSLRRWPVRMAYYPPDTAGALPEFEMSMDLYDNGVAGHMIFDYGDFAMRASLESVELYTPPDCPPRS